MLRVRIMAKAAITSVSVKQDRASVDQNLAMGQGGLFPTAPEPNLNRLNDAVTSLQRHHGTHPFRAGLFQQPYAG